MPRKLQDATISFGLVSIPVNLYTAVSPQNVSFHLMHAKCGSRIKQQTFCPVDNEVVPRNELVRGYEITKDQHVQLTEEELESLERDASDSMEITEFVPLETVDPMSFEKTYYLGPGKGGDKPYRLLARAMAKSGRVALAKFIMRGKENLMLIRSLDGGLVLHTMYYANEVRDFSEVPKGEASATEAELNLATRLIDELSVDEFHPERYQDEYRERVLEMVSQKAEGKEITVGAPGPKRGEVIDLMDALKASLGKGAPKEKRAAARSRRAEEPPAPARRAHAGRK